VVECLSDFCYLLLPVVAFLRRCCNWQAEVLVNFVKQTNVAYKPCVLQSSGSKCTSAPAFHNGIKLTMVRSRLQKDVLKLYRQCLRAAEGKPGTASTIKAQFRVNAAIPKYIIKLSLLYNNSTVWFSLQE
jgi:hypothetical protein